MNKTSKYRTYNNENCHRKVLRQGSERGVGVVIIQDGQGRPP